MVGAERDKDTVLPVLLEGSPRESFPPLLHNRVHADFRDPENYFSQALLLIRSL